MTYIEQGHRIHSSDAFLPFRPDFGVFFTNRPANHTAYVSRNKKPCRYCHHVGNALYMFLQRNDGLYDLRFSAPLRDGPR